MLDRPVPNALRAWLSIADGGELGPDRLFSTAEIAEQWLTWPDLVAGTYAEDPDWGAKEPPRDLLPIATDDEGNLRCLDLSSPGPEIVEWRRETAEITTLFRELDGWLVAALRTVGLRFDSRGRPKPLRAGAEQAMPGDIEVHLSVEPDASVPRLDRALWFRERGTPEDALFAHREASAAWPPRAVNDWQHALFALRTGRTTEARGAIRRALSRPTCADPRKHSFRGGVLAAAHGLLAELYVDVGQVRKSDEQRALAERAAKKYGSDGYAESDELQDALALVKKGRRHQRRRGR